MKLAFFLAGLKNFSSDKMKEVAIRPPSQCGSVQTSFPFLDQPPLCRSFGVDDSVQRYKSSG